MKRDLTQEEILRLPETYNLTDGHAHRPPEPNEQAILDRLTDIFASIDREQQPVLEDSYIDAFYKLHKQTVDKKKTHYLMLPSASMSLEMAGNYLRLNNLDLALTEPCFDVLANIFTRHGVTLESIPDTCMETENWGGVLETLQSKAICLVSPNNPTGIAYTQANFELLIKHCQRYGKLLIMDTSFRAFRPADARFDEYKLLQASGIDYIVIEDTGKTWPTKELKVSILAASLRVHEQLYDVYTEFILHNSPFIIKLLTEFIEASTIDELRGVRQAIEANRRTLYRALKGTILEPVERKSVGLAWLTIKNDMLAEGLTARLAKDGIFVLPGNYFFWSDKSQGRKFIRVSLNRDPKVFQAAITRLRAILDTL